MPIKKTTKKAKAVEPVSTVCAVCSGKGRIDDKTSCDACEGTGVAK